MPVNGAIEASSEAWVFVEDSPFLPPRGGGQREHRGLLRAAREAGVLAAVVLPVAEPVAVSAYEAELGAPVVTTPRRTSPARLLHPTMPFVVASRPPSRGLSARVAAVAPGMTGIVVSTYKSWAIGRALARDLALPAIIRLHNRESLYHQSLADETSGAQRLAYLWEARRIQRDEARLSTATWLRGIADISSADAAWRRSHGGLPVAHVPPFAVDPRTVPPRHAHPAGAPTVLFLGALDVPTNHAALAWLLDAVWPRVRRRRSDAALSVVGARPSNRLRQQVAAVPGASLHADVPDIAPYLDSAWVAVNPSVTGSGVNIKLVEYMTAGIPVVATSFSTQGLPLRAGVDLAVHDEPDAYADAIVRLLDDTSAAMTMGETGRGRLLDVLDPPTNIDRLRALMQGGAVEPIA